MLKRIFDIVFSSFGLILFSPLFIVIAMLIKLDSRGNVFYKQSRVGLGDKDFSLLKFRSMRIDSDKQGLLTVSDRDDRITPVGRFLRKYKLDELPQLINILSGDMSFVGPRPEVRKYVMLYNEDQKQVLEVRPGLTDYASLEYINENEILGRSDDPEKTYIDEIMPAKLELNQKYIREQSFGTDLGIILKTIGKIAR